MSANPAYGNSEEEYTEVFQQGEEGEEMYTEIPDDIIKKHDSANYVEKMEEFLPQRSANRADTTKEDFSVKTQEIEAEEKTSSSQSFSKSLHYVNDLDEIARELKKVDLGSEADTRHKDFAGKDMFRTKEGSKVNLLSAAVEDQASDEDEEGYTIFDPKMAEKIRGKKGGHHNIAAKQDASTAKQGESKDVSEKDDTYYGNNSVILQASLKRGRTSETSSFKQGMAPSGSDVRPYVNDLEALVAEVKLREKEQKASAEASMERGQKSEKSYEQSMAPSGRPYVNDLEGLVAEVKLREREEGRSAKASMERGQKSEESDEQDMAPSGRPYVNDLEGLVAAAKLREREERGSAGGGRVSVGTRHHPYVNDMAKLLQEALGDDQLGRDDMERSLEVPRQEEEGASGSHGVPEKMNNYVNDLAGLMSPLKDRGN